MELNMKESFENLMVLILRYNDLYTEIKQYYKKDN